MRGMLIFAICVAALSGAPSAQEPTRRPRGMGPGPAVSGLDVVGFGPMDPNEPILGAPFRAEATTQTTQLLANGNRIERQFASVIARDSRGRVRREQPLPPLAPLGPAPNVTIITISDPAQRVQYFLDVNRKTAVRMVAAGLPGRDAVPPPARLPLQEGARGPQMRTEILGSKTVAGVQAQGTKTTMTIPAGAFGNTDPIEVVTERWYSPDLHIVVSSRRSDPLMGEVVFNVVNLIRAEPPSDLFEIPADFTVRERRALRPPQND